MAKTLTGVVTGEPRYWTSPKGCPCLKFEIWLAEKKDGAWKKNVSAKVVPVIAFGPTAEQFKSLRKSTVVQVSGELKENTFNDRTREELTLGFNRGFIKVVEDAPAADESAEQAECVETRPCPDYEGPEPTEQDFEDAARYWAEPYPRTGEL